VLTKVKLRLLSRSGAGTAGNGHEYARTLSLQERTSRGHRRNWKIYQGSLLFWAILLLIVRLM